MEEEKKAKTKQIVRRVMVKKKKIRRIERYYNFCHGVNIEYLRCTLPAMVN